MSWAMAFTEIPDMIATAILGLTDNKILIFEKCGLSVWQSVPFNLPINKYYDIINYYVEKE
jgi:hypothetical protein